jgi:hypothetical protein
MFGLELPESVVDAALNVDGKHAAPRDRHGSSGLGVRSCSYFFEHLLPVLG